MKTSPLLCCFALAGLLFLSACHTRPTTSPTFKDAANTVWKLDQWTSTDGTVQPPAVITVALAEGGQIAGHSGVNRYSGTIVIKPDDSIDWSPLVSTKMAGAPEAMNRETRYLSDLTATRRAHLSKDRLIFTGPKPVRLEFVRVTP